jgi:hypothetical protein
VEYKDLTGRSLTPAEAYAMASPTLRRNWFPDGPPPETKAYEPLAGSPSVRVKAADPGRLLAQDLALNRVEQDVRAMQADAAIREQVRFLEASLIGAMLALPPTDPTAPRPLSAAERRYRDDLETAFARKLARVMS